FKKEGNIIRNLVIRINDYWESLELLAISDVLIQGCGSSTVYESFAGMAPSVALPLHRPGHEQLIKAVGLKQCGAGEVLLTEAMHSDGNVIGELKRVGLSLEQLTTGSLEQNLRKIVENRDRYLSALQGLQSHFGSKEQIGKSVLLMSQGASAQEIIKEAGLEGLC
ncbi:hypothetical protein JXC34_01480, partial [Candidatus Woesearchaeota archaeon]|nr:hypothetical protein [Candidatus Woesearchaeota archaeon]